MGVRKVAVTAIEPFGCLPDFTVVNSFQQCNETANTLAKLHNTLLQLAVAKLNSESKDPGAFIILDLYDAFASVLNNKGNFSFCMNRLNRQNKPRKGLKVGKHDHPVHRIWGSLMIIV